MRSVRGIIKNAVERGREVSQEQNTLHRRLVNAGAVLHCPRRGEVNVGYVIDYRLRRRC